MGMHLTPNISDEFAVDGDLTCEDATSCLISCQSGADAYEFI